MINYTKEKYSSIVTLSLEDYDQLKSYEKQVDILTQEMIDKTYTLRENIEKAIEAVHGGYDFKSSFGCYPIKYYPEPSSESIIKKVKEMSFWEKLKLLFLLK